MVGDVFRVNQISLGEMISFLPIPGGHIKLAERFVDPSLSFSMGWNYWLVPVSTVIIHWLNILSRYNWVVVLPAELSAVAVLIGFWDKEQTVNPAVWIAITMVIVIFINLLGAGKFDTSCHTLTALNYFQAHMARLNLFLRTSFQFCPSIHFFRRTKTVQSK
jgi:amino acid transporter